MANRSEPRSPLPEVELDFDMTQALVPGGVLALLDGKVPTPRNPRWQTCVHEAGHAVVATALVGAQVDDVEIYRAGGGHCGVRWTTNEEGILSTLGGLGAQLIFSDARFAPIFLRDASLDIQAARGLIGIPDGDPDEMDDALIEKAFWCLDELARLMATTKLVLQHMRGAVLALAKRLRRREQMWGVDVRKIVDANKPTTMLEGSVEVRAMVLARYGGAASRAGRPAPCEPVSK